MTEVEFAAGFFDRGESLPCMGSHQSSDFLFIDLFIFVHEMGGLSGGCPALDEAYHLVFRLRGEIFLQLPLLRNLVLVLIDTATEG